MYIKHNRLQYSVTVRDTNKRKLRGRPTHSQTLNELMQLTKNGRTGCKPRGPNVNYSHNMSTKTVARMPTDTRIEAHK